MFKGIFNFRKPYISLAVVAALSLFMSSCDAIFEYEGDCEPKHRIRFVYDMNLKWADAFPSEVKSVNLYVFDEDGIFVKEYLGRGEELQQPGYSILLDVPAGKTYNFVAWCGLENEGAKEESFSVPHLTAGVSTLSDLTCTMNTMSTPPAYLTRSDAEGDADTEYSDSQLYFLYHGMLKDEELPDTQDGGTYYHTVYLTKDTNHIRIILQELSYDEGLNPDDYSFSIENANGEMAYDNALIGTTEIVYTPWAQTADELGVGRVEINNGEIKYIKGVVADLSVGRLMASEKDKLFLTITNTTDGTVIARVPLLQYALLSRPYYEEAYRHTMTDQEFLDREDEYVMTFFMYNNRWLSAYVDILQWRIVLHNYELGD